MMIQHGLTFGSLSVLFPSCRWMPLRCTRSCLLRTFSPHSGRVETSLHSCTTSWFTPALTSTTCNKLHIDSINFRWVFHFAGVHRWVESMLFCSVPSLFFVLWTVHPSNAVCFGMFLNAAISIGLNEHGFSQHQDSVSVCPVIVWFFILLFHSEPSVSCCSFKGQIHHER